MRGNRLDPIKPQDVDFGKQTTEPGHRGRGPVTHDVKVKVGTEDIVAIFAGVIAVIFALGMVFGKLPVNALTIGVLGFSAAGGAIAKIIKARSGRATAAKGEGHK
jgi:hypothetical protein